jgi:hypothetical protein
MIRGHTPVQALHRRAQADGNDVGAGVEDLLGAGNRAVVLVVDAHTVEAFHAASP